MEKKAYMYYCNLIFYAILSDSFSLIYYSVSLKCTLYVKILQAGKTAVSNFLADATEGSSGEYHPTQGVRWTHITEIDKYPMYLLTVNVTAFENSLSLN